MQHRPAVMYSDHKISVAPMMGYTDRHARYLYRLMSPAAWLYTEMLTAQAVTMSSNSNLLAFHQAEHPVVLQLGGADPALMTSAAAEGQKAGYDEININVGCPSDRVQSGVFGACLMASPRVVADCVRAMRDRVDIPVTVKTRTGIDDHDSYAELVDFIANVSAAGCSRFIVHARKAWLHGLSPKQNREVPPLDYARVYRLKADMPHLEIIVNGGITAVQDVKKHLQHVDGVMLGREITRNPWLLVELEKLSGRDKENRPHRDEIRQQYARYIDTELGNGVTAQTLVKPLFGLYQGMRGARKWRRMLTEAAQGKSGSTDDLPELVANYDHLR